MGKFILSFVTQSLKRMHYFQDMLKRIANGQTLIEFLSNLEGNIKWDNIDRIVDSLATYWVASSNFKVRADSIELGDYNIISLCQESILEVQSNNKNLFTVGVGHNLARCWSMVKTCGFRW